MVSSSGVVLDPESDTLSPLPTYLYRGLTGVTVIASISLFSTATLFLHLTYKLIRLEIKERRKVRATATQHGVDLSLGLSERHFAAMGHRPTTRQPTPPRQVVKAKPNQFVILIYNLLLADMHQAMAFFLNAAWISRNEITVGAGPCWVQGWYVSTGDLASSCFIMAIAVHTYLTVIRQYRPPQWAVNTAVIGIWIFVYVMSMLGIALTRNGRAAGGWFVRAAAWCWINVKYENYRLVTHYLFIFIALAVTSGIYTLIFFTLRSRTAKEEAARLNNDRRSNHHKGSMDDRETAASTHTPAIKQGAGHHPGFFIYPVIYVICTLPLALGRIATMAGADVSQSYFCAAAALIVSNGWLDVLLWGSTRRTLIFGDIDKEDALGLETFTFMRTPHGRQYGNMVWVQGNSDGEVLPGGAGDRNLSLWNRLGFGRQTRAHERQLRHGGHRRTGERSISQESLRGAGRNNDMGMAIQMDTVTTVVVEVEPDIKGGGGSSRGRETSTHSLNGSEKEVSHRV